MGAGEVRFLAFASNFGHFSGPNVPVLDLGNYMESHWPGEFGVVTHAGDGDPDFLDRVSFHRYPTMHAAASGGLGRLGVAPSNLAAARNSISEHRPEHVIVLSGIDLAFEVSWAMRARLALGHNILLNTFPRSWIRSEGWDVPPPSRRQDLVFRVLDRLAAATVVDRILAHSEFHKHLYMMLGIPPERITIVPHCVDVNRIRQTAETAPRASKIPDTFSLLFIGRLEPEKGVLALLEAARLASERVRIHLRIVGQGRLRPAVQDAATASARTRSLTVQYDPELPLAQLLGAISGADAVIIPSFLEPFGMVALESMSLGKPIIGVRRGGLAEVVRDRKEGIMVDAPSPPRLASSIRLLAEDEALCRRLGENGFKRVVETYDVTVVGPSFIRFMESAR